MKVWHDVVIQRRAGQTMSDLVGRYWLVSTCEDIYFSIIGFFAIPFNLLVVSNKKNQKELLPCVSHQSPC